MSYALLFVALAALQSPRTPDVGEPRRLESGVVALPHDWIAGQLLVPGDLDGNGLDDLMVSRVERRFCGADTASGAVDRLSSGRFPMARSWAVRGQPVLAVGTRAGVPALVVGHSQLWEDSTAIDLRSLDGGTVHWSLRPSELAIRAAHRTCALPASAPDGTSAVVVANAWARSDESLASYSGAVMKLSGSDGSTEWVHWGRHPDACYGLDVAPAGDVDGDGVCDVAVSVAAAWPSSADPERRLPHVEILSGADGSVLARRALGAERVAEMRAVGDLDGDGRVDFAARGMEEVEAGGRPLWLALSGRAEPLAVLPEQEIRWFVPWRDDGGRAGLLVGARDHTGGTRSLQLVGADGARRFADDPVGADVAIDLAESGDFDGDGRLDVALVLRAPCGSCEDAHVLRVVSGLELR